MLANAGNCTSRLHCGYASAIVLLLFSITARFITQEDFQDRQAYPRKTSVDATAQISIETYTFREEFFRLRLVLFEAYIS